MLALKEKESVAGNEKQASVMIWHFLRNSKMHPRKTSEELKRGLDESGERVS